MFLLTIPSFQDQTPTVQKLSDSKLKEINKEIDTDDLDFSDLTMDQTKVEEEKPKEFVFMLTGSLLLYKFQNIIFTITMVQWDMGLFKDES